jgi:hypothetical protein
MGHFDDSVDSFDLVQGVQTGGETSMQAEDLILNDSGQGQVIKQVSKEFPDVCVAVLAHALVVEAVNLGDLAALVVSSEDGESISVAHLQTHEQGHSLD